MKPEHKAQVAEELREAFLAGQKAYTPDKAHKKQAFSNHWGTHYSTIRKLANRSDLPYYFTYLGLPQKVEFQV